MTNKNKKIFRNVDSDDLIDPWPVPLIGGDAQRDYDQLTIADSYVDAALILVDRAHLTEEPWTLIYPILFLCRHAIELYLKITIPTNKDHPLKDKLDAFVLYMQQEFNQKIPSWLIDIVKEFNEFDPGSTTFRYEDGGQKIEKLYKTGEYIVDLPQLRESMKRIRLLFQRVLKEKLSKG